MFSRDGHVRIERVGLEHHGDVAVLGRQVVDDGGRRCEISPAVMSSRPAIMRSSVRLAAAGRADQDDELAVVDREVDAVQHADRCRRILADVCDVDRCHGAPQPLTAPAVRPCTR